MKASKKMNTTPVELTRLAKLFFHKVTDLTAEQYKENMVAQWQLDNNEMVSPELILTRQFILEQAWQDFQSQIIEIIRDFAHVLEPQKHFKHNILYPFNDSMDFVFNQHKISFQAPHHLSEAVVENFNRPYIDFIVPPENPANCMLITYNNALMSAISLSESDRSIKLIQLGVDINRYSPIHGNNPLLLTTIKGWNHIDSDVDEDAPAGQQKMILETLLSRNDLDINAIHALNGLTALHIACMRGDEPTFIELLLQKGAAFNRQDCLGKTPSDYLDLSYSELKDTIAILCGDNQFGSATLAAHQTFSATLPKPEERERHIMLIKKIFTRIQQENSHSSELVTAKRRQF